MANASGRFKAMSKSVCFEWFDRQRSFGPGWAEASSTAWRASIDWPDVAEGDGLDLRVAVAEPLDKARDIEE